MEALSKSHLHVDHYYTDHRSWAMINIVQMLSAVGTALHAFLQEHYSLLHGIFIRFKGVGHIITPVLLMKKLWLGRLR